MTDAAGATFSLMYLPSNAIGLPAAVGAIVPLTTATMASLGLSAAWTVPLTMPLGGGSSSESMVLCAVYQVGQTPSL